MTADAVKNWIRKRWSKITTRRFLTGRSIYVDNLYRLIWQRRGEEKLYLFEEFYDLIEEEDEVKEDAIDQENEGQE